MKIFKGYIFPLIYVGVYRESFHLMPTFFPYSPAAARFFVTDDYSERFHFRTTEEQLMIRINWAVLAEAAD